MADEFAESKALPLAREGPGSLDYWNEQIDRSKAAIRQIKDQFEWQKHVDRYVGKGQTSIPSKDVVLLPKDYAYAEQKKALLFYQKPDVVLTPARPDVAPGTALLFEAVLNNMTGPDQLNCKATIDEVLTDVLVPSGIGIIKIGYELFTDPRQPQVPMETGAQEPVADELTGRPKVDPMTGRPMMKPVVQMVPNAVRERFFVSRISPLDLLYDTSFKGSDWTKARWVGHRFRMPQIIAEAMFGESVDSARVKTTNAQQPSPEQSLTPDKVSQSIGGVEGVCIYYYAMDVDPRVGDPDLIRELVLLDNQIEPAKHQDCPYQVVEDGRVVGGLRRFPIYPLTIHYVPDTAIPPSDCSMSRVIVDELSKGRTQMLQQRDRNVPMRGVDITKISADAKEKVLKGNFQQIIPLENVTSDPFFAIQQSAFPQENFNFNNYGERDLQECWGLSSNNLGSSNTSGRTATELSIMQQATDTRMESDRTRVLQWWVQIVQGLAALVQLFATEEQYVSVLGPNGAQQLVAWNNQKIAGEYAFSVRPDSARRVDQAAERKFRLDVYNLLANSPHVNQQELIRWISPAIGFDPDKILAQPKEPEPDPPKVAIAIRGDDLIIPQVVELLAQRGITLTGAAPALGGQPPPPGGPQQGAPEATPVNKHTLDETGRLPGAGQATQPN